jgi:hypothetical protein
MSGPATVPFAIAALYVSSNRLRALYGTMAVFCAGYTSYRMWLTERVSLETELEKNQFPTITTEIERAYISPVGIRSGNVFVLASVHNLNAAMACTVKRYELTICIAGKDYFGKQLPVTGFEMCLDQPRMSVADSIGLEEGPLLSLNDAVTDLSPLRRGIPVRGWLKYGFDDLPPWPLLVGRGSDFENSAKFDNSVVLSVTLTVIDAFDRTHPVSRTPPWRNVGTISLVPVAVSIDELAEAIVEFSRQAKKENPMQFVALEESELAEQFNETRGRISKALVLLSQQGRAKRTSRPESWAL